MKYEYHFTKWKNTQLMEFLNEQKIEYQEGSNQLWIVFSIFSSSPKAEFYLEELKKMNIRENYITVEFTKKELSEADFLMMRPKRQSIDIENEDAFRYTCEWTSRLGEKVFQHEEQVKEVVVKKVTSMKKRNAFWCESTGFSVIFADKRIRRLAEENFLSGIEFKNVFLKNGTCSDELFQMTSSNILKKECIVFGYGEKIEKCPKCGKEQYVTDHVWQLHLDFSKIERQSDLYVTERIFGEGFARPIYVISQKFYRLLVENKLDKNVTFFPVVNVDI